MTSASSRRLQPRWNPGSETDRTFHPEERLRIPGGRARRLARAECHRPDGRAVYGFGGPGLNPGRARILPEARAAIRAGGRFRPPEDAVQSRRRGWLAGL